MQLNLTRSVRCPPDKYGEFDNYRKHTVVHEFGHALGLDHEHQMKRIASELDKEKVLEYLKDQCHLKDADAKAKYEEDFKKISWWRCIRKSPSKGAEFDPQSVMCYP